MLSLLFEYVAAGQLKQALLKRAKYGTDPKTEKRGLATPMRA